MRWPRRRTQANIRDGNDGRAGISALPDSTHPSEAIPFPVWTCFAFGGLRGRRIKSSNISWFPVEQQLNNGPLKATEGGNMGG
jgi:hypothetical protein